MPSYIIYCRKSSESEERQVLSIESQIKELSDLTKKLQLPVSEVLTESRSAKSPGRPVFGRLMEKVSRGEVKGIISWKLDRLARNPMDGGAIVWALDQGKIEEIITPGNHLRNNSNDKFLMQLEFGMAKKYVDDLSDNVKRGLRMKLEKGWLPGLAPIGYLNEPREKTIVPDPERFTVIRKIWELLLQGHAPMRILQIATEEWGLRTLKHKRRGGGPLCVSSIYKIFTNPFYYGMIQRKGTVYQGKHRPMITVDEYWRAQRTLGREGKPRPKIHEFAFTGLMRCGECGSAITAEEKINRFGSHYIYYHCTKKNHRTHCAERCIRLEKLEGQMMEFLERIHVPERLLRAALDFLKTEELQEQENEVHRKESVDGALDNCQRKLDNLNQMRLKDLINDEEYATEKRELLDEKIHLERNLDVREEIGRVNSLTAETFVFAAEALERFKNGSLEEKRAILHGIGSNPTLKDRKLFIDAQKPFVMIKDSLHSVISENGPLEPEKNVMNTSSVGLSHHHFLLMCGLVEDVRTFYLEKIRAENGESIRHAA